MAAFYIARQPILDVHANTFGYELLFRSTEKNAYDPSIDGDTATANVLVNSIVEAGLESIVGSSKAFVNLTQRFVENPHMLDILVPGSCVLEVLENVVVTDDVVAGVEALRDKGHTIALDDFVDDEKFTQLLPLAHIVKYDLTQHSMEELASYRLKDASAGRLSLAERVETYEQFDALKQAGFQFFQGYFFAKPKVICGTKLPQNKVAVIQLLAQISDPATSIDELAETLSRDVSLSIRTIQYVNSPLCGTYGKVCSIRHAVVMLGREHIRNWVTLLVLSGIDNKPPELTKLALTRARFCQLMAQKKGLANDAMYFTLGLLSLLGVMMDLELDDALEKVPITDEMRKQVLYGFGQGGEMRRLVTELEKPSPQIGPGNESVGPVYQHAIIWTEEAFGWL